MHIDARCVVSKHRYERDKPDAAGAPTDAYGGAVYECRMRTLGNTMHLQTSHASAVEAYIQYALSVTAVAATGCTDEQRNGLREFLRVLLDARDFAVTLEQLAEVLRQSALCMRRLLMTPDFKQDKDYRVESSTVLLTVDAFVQLAMMARGERALQVRRYLTVIESVSREFRMHQIKAERQRMLARPAEAPRAFGHAAGVASRANGYTYDAPRTYAMTVSAPASVQYRARASCSMLVCNCALMAMNAPYVRIVARTASEYKHSGIAGDSALYASLLRDMGYRVLVQSEHEAARDDDATPADANLFLEHASRALLRTARHNYFMVNQEIKHDAAAYPYLDAVLCKTQYARALMQRVADTRRYAWRAVYTSHSSEDVRDTRVCKRAGEVLHAAGKSLNKNTSLVLALWLRRTDLPLLHVVLDPCVVPVPPEAYCAANICMHATLPPHELRALQNRCALHLCPSEAEGFGHYINEARAVGAVVLTTNAPPMNELVTDGESGLLVPVKPGCHANRYGPAVPGGCTFRISEQALERTVERYLALSDTQRKQLGGAARARYEHDTEHMRCALRQVFAREALAKPSVMAMRTAARWLPVLLPVLLLAVLAAALMVTRARFRAA